MMDLFMTALKLGTGNPEAGTGGWGTMESLQVSLEI